MEDGPPIDMMFHVAITDEHALFVCVYMTNSASVAQVQASSSIVLSLGAPSFGGGASFETLDFSLPSYDQATSGGDITKSSSSTSPKTDDGDAAAKAAAKEEARRAAEEERAAAKKAEAEAKVAQKKAEEAAAAEAAEKAAAKEAAKEERKVCGYLFSLQNSRF